MIKVDGLAKHFGALEAVRDVSFTACDGEITGLLGPNGAGKTTTLRMITGLLPPDRGAIRIDGVDPGAEPLAARRRLGVLPDARGLYRRLTGRENLLYFGRLQGLSANECEARAEELIATLNMSDFAGRRAEGYSNGQRVKVAIARALIHRPRNVLLDEPTNGLDIMSIRALRRFVAELAAAGHAVILSTHVMQEVAALCRRIVIIAGGEVVADGSGDELLSRTGAATLEDAFVALTGGEGMAA